MAPAEGDAKVVGEGHPRVKGWLLAVAVSLATGLGVGPGMRGPLLLFAAGESSTHERTGDLPSERDRTGGRHPVGDATKGQVLYDASCIVCHGAGARGGVGPRLAGNPILSNEQLFWDRVLKGRHMMPPLADALTPQQIADIQAWLKTLR
jgi:mono/diheme cytochrome c family protein